MPDGLTPTVIRENLIAQFSEVQEVQPVYVWQLTEDRLVATVCITAKAGTCAETLRVSVKHYLQKKLRLNLVTVEVIGEPQAGIVVSASESSANDNDL